MHHLTLFLPHKMGQLSIAYSNQRYRQRNRLFKKTSITNKIMMQKSSGFRSVSFNTEFKIIKILFCTETLNWIHWSSKGYFVFLGYMSHWPSVFGLWVFEFLFIHSCYFLCVTYFPILVSCVLEFISISNLGCLGYQLVPFMSLSLLCFLPSVSPS